jgi:imidazolonepropionase-like amidohydrolase
MKKLIITSILSAIGLYGFSQETIYPAPAQKGPLYIYGGTVHVGNGQVIENATIQIADGKIVKVATNIPIPRSADVKVVDATGKQVYPGLILPSTDIGLKEISGAVRGSNDYRELGDMNPNVRAIAAYNTDSKFINPLRSMGILLASVEPQGSLVLGSSSVVQLDAWNWEDALYAGDNAMHIEMPSFIVRGRRRQGPATDAANPSKEAFDRIAQIKTFFTDAKSYLAEKTHETYNLKLEAARPLFEKKQKLFVHANEVKQMLLAIDFAKEFGFEVVIVGGSESFQIAGLLQQNNIAVILNQEHALPTADDDDVDQPYKTPAVLKKAGVLFALNDADNNTRYRNLPFNAGTSAAYGLTKEEALTAITLNAAKILGIDSKTGSLEAGKDANIVISEGDILDMRTSVVTAAFIQGRSIILDDKQKQLSERYKQKYGIK